MRSITREKQDSPLGGRCRRFRQAGWLRTVILAPLLMLSGVLVTCLILSPSSAEQTRSSAPAKPSATKAVVDKHANPVIGEPAAHTDAERVVSPEPVPPPIPAGVRSEAILGKPYGIAQLAIPIRAELRWRPDQPITIQVAGDRLLFPCYTVRQWDEGAELIVRFLFRGSEQLVVDVRSSNGEFVKGHAVKVDDDAATHKTLLTGWWQNYTEQLIEGPSEELSELGRDIATILGHRFDLPTPSRRRDDSDSSDLEKQFERTAGMLLGFESVRLAMMKDTSAVEASDLQAVLPLPTPIPVAAVPVPDFTNASVEIEPLASHVPPECFYLRCRSLENYIWMRGLVIGWGGSLDEMVATPVIDQKIRERIEQQLCLDSSLAMKLDLDGSLDDFAILGGDTYFAEGAAIGVLMLAKKPSRVQAILYHIRHTKSENAHVERQTVMISGQEVSYYETSDNSIRSFHVSNGNCHLVTNSRTMVERFLACGQGQNLAALPEFRHARSKFTSNRDLTAFLYLSDPFFRSLTSPATRIEASRRLQATAELRQLNLARLIAVAEGIDVTSISDLIHHQLLPPDFGQRADGSSPLWPGDGQLIDSLRGGLGTFLPISDVSISQATQSEVKAYASFTRRYFREWRAMDPVTVALHRQRSLDLGEERVDVEIAITPYARNAYDFLVRYLAPASRRRIRPSSADVLTLTARLQGDATYDVCVGLRDVAVPFRVERGSLVKDGAFADHTFADLRSYAVTTPAGTNGLKILDEFTRSLQSRQIVASRPSLEWSAGVLSNTSFWIAAVNPIPYFPGTVVHATISHAVSALSTAFIDTNGAWTLMARDGALRREVADELRIEHAHTESQIQLRLRDVNQAKVGPYLHAVSWETGRRLSGENAVWLSRLASTLRLDLLATRQRVERVLGGEFRCPLGGRYEFRSKGNQNQMVSTAWENSSRFDETAVPATYRLPFLTWLRGMKLDFQLSPSTLTSRVELYVNPTVVNATQEADNGEATIQLIAAVVATEREQLYQRLLTAHRQLGRGLGRLDPSLRWTEYLEIPAKAPHDESTRQKMRKILARFERVASDRKYEVIARITGFNETRARLEECVQQLDDTVERQR